MIKRTDFSKSTELHSARRQKGFLSSRQGLVLLLLIFLAPTFVAWVMHNSGKSGWQPEGLTNKGTLVHPARPLGLPADMRAAEMPLNDYLQGKWTLLYFGDADCDDACNTNLYNMRQVHILQNEHMRRVQRLFLLRSDTLPETLASLLEQEYPDMTVTSVTAEQAQQIAPDFLIDGVSMQGAERIYIIDPLGNLMMYYPPGTDPGGMHKDLKKLLKYSKIG
jgi:cytochrome oxidase Cu insertion factor (SCO1/SenC/PrrC family)